MKLLLLLIISFGLNIDCRSQAIFSVKKNNKYAILIAGFHKPVKMSEDIKFKLDNVIKKASIIYIESRGGIPSISERIEASRLNGERSIGEMISEHKPSCLSDYRSKLKNNVSGQPVAMHLGVTAFLIYNVTPPSFGVLTNNTLDLSVDDYIQIVSIALNKKTIEIESPLNMVVGISKKLNQDKMLFAAEVACKKINEITSNVSNRKKFDLEKMWIQYLDGNVDQIRESVLESYFDIGYPADLMYELFDVREERFFSYAVDQMDAKKVPIFVIGAAHLGAGGLLERFKNSGYNIERLN